MKRLMQTAGFTLIEIMVALFIFTIISMMLVASLYTVISAQSETEKKSERLRVLQHAILLMSRDIEQIVDRPVVSSSGQVEPSFVGAPTRAVFTFGGYANPSNVKPKSSLRRGGYEVTSGMLQRLSWEVLDRVSSSVAITRDLVPDVVGANFQYLDQKGIFHPFWPLDTQNSQPLPRAVRITLTISQWGTITQLYVIEARQNPEQFIPPAQQTS